MEKTILGNSIFDLISKSEETRVQSWLRVWKSFVNLDDIMEHSDFNELINATTHYVISAGKQDGAVKFVFGYDFQHGGFGRYMDFGVVYDKHNLSLVDWLVQMQAPGFIFRRHWNEDPSFGKPDKFVAIFPQYDRHKEDLWELNPLAAHQWRNWLIPELHPHLLVVHKAFHEEFLGEQRTADE